MSRPSGPLAVVIPALNEETTIAEVVGDFRAQDEVAFVIVVDNGSLDGTAERARGAGARVVDEPRPGYGAALRRGIEHALAEGAGSVALVEADGTFDASQLPELLRALDTHALVLGSRAQALPGRLGLGNRAVAGLLALLWPRRACSLSDVGCTFRVFTAAAWRELAAGTTSDGPEFSPQMICEAFRRGLPVCERAVRYGVRRGGESKHTGSLLATARTATRMLRAILAKRLEAAPPR